MLPTRRLTALAAALLLIGAMVWPEWLLADPVRLGFARGVDNEDISGNAQIGIAENPLGRPLRVQVTDVEGKPLEGVLVEFRLVEKESRFQPAEGLPQVDEVLVETNPSGYASTRVRIGNRHLLGRDYWW